jgi:hypothetical protein
MWKYLSTTWASSWGFPAAGCLPREAKLVADRAGDTLVGATFVGTDAAELLHSATTVIVGKVTLDTLWHAVPSHPTVSEVWLRLLESRGKPRPPVPSTWAWETSHAAHPQRWCSDGHLLVHHAALSGGVAGPLDPT